MFEENMQVPLCDHCIEKLRCNLCGEGIGLLGAAYRDIASCPVIVV
jgi:hypothetical protein